MEWLCDCDRAAGVTSLKFAVNDLELLENTGKIDRRTEHCVEQTILHYLLPPPSPPTQSPPSLPRKVYVEMGGICKL